MMENKGLEIEATRVIEHLTRKVAQLSLEVAQYASLCEQLHAQLNTEGQSPIPASE